MHVPHRRRPIRRKRPPPPAAPPASPVTPQIVRGIVAARLLRARYLGIPAADPAWTLMLLLYAAHLEASPLAPAALAAAAEVSPATCRGLLRTLAQAGLVALPADAGAPPALTPQAARRMRDYLDLILTAALPAR